MTSPGTILRQLQQCPSLKRVELCWFDGPRDWPEQSGPWEGLEELRICGITRRSVLLLPRVLRPMTNLRQLSLQAQDPGIELDIGHFRPLGRLRSLEMTDFVFRAPRVPSTLVSWPRLGSLSLRGCRNEAVVGPLVGRSPGVVEKTTVTPVSCSHCRGSRIKA